MRSGLQDTNVRYALDTLFPNRFTADCALIGTLTVVFAGFTNLAASTRSTSAAGSQERCRYRFGLSVQRGKFFTQLEKEISPSYLLFGGLFVQNPGINAS